MNDEDLKRIEERIALLGKSEWFYHYSGDCIQPHGVMFKTRNGFAAICSTTYANEPSKRDAEFIAHARQDVPALLDEVKRLRLQVHASVEENEKMMLERNGFAEKANAAERLIDEAKAILRRVVEHTPPNRITEDAEAFLQGKPLKRKDETPCDAPDATGTLRCEKPKGHAGNHYGDNGLDSGEWFQK